MSGGGGGGREKIEISLHKLMTERCRWGRLVLQSGGGGGYPVCPVTLPSGQGECREANVGNKQRSMDGIPIGCNCPRHPHPNGILLKIAQAPSI